jgi:hypothetical protein
MMPPGAASVARIFGVPIVLISPDIDTATRAGVVEQLLEERRNEPGLRLSNAGGWHSRPDLARRDDPALTNVIQAILAAVEVFQGEVFQGSLAAADGATPPAWRYGIQAWAMVMEAGDYTVPHDHAEAHWSFVYYLDTGDADRKAHPRSGMIAWINPAPPHTPVPGLDYAPRAFELAPRTGQLVLFPGWLGHYVHPYRGTRPRISIAGNVRVDG